MLPQPPRLGRPAATSRRRVLSQERIVDAGIAAVAARGLDGLSMRVVADALGTGPASLYAHVSGKDELVALMLERVAAAAELPEPDPDRWQEQVKQIVRDRHAALLAHRDLARAAPGARPLSEPALRADERLLEILALGGLPQPVVAHAFELLRLYAISTAAEQALLHERNRTEEGARYLEEVGAYLAEHLPALPGSDPGERFEFGLDVLVAGIAAYGRRASTA